MFNYRSITISQFFSQEGEQKDEAVQEEYGKLQEAVSMYKSNGEKASSKKRKSSNLIPFVLLNTGRSGGVGGVFACLSVKMSPML